VATYHDVFDRPDMDARLNNLPTNADGWHLGIGGNLTVDPDGYLADTDDNVALPGSAMQSWLRMTEHKLISVQTTLAHTMYEHSVTWCDACDLFFAHDPDVPLTATTRARWQACMAGDLEKIVGPPPDPHLNLFAPTCTQCPGGMFSDADGICVACTDPRAVVVANVCTTCPAGTIPSLDNRCTPCEADEISVGTACGHCIWGTEPDRATNTCMDCAPSFSVDWAAASPECNTATFANIMNSHPVCPFVIEVLNVSSIPPVADPANTLDVEIYSNKQQPAGQCALTDVDLHFAFQANTTTGSLPRTEGSSSAAGAPCTQPFCTANCSYTANIFSKTAADLAADGQVDLRVMLDTDILNGANTSVVVTTGPCGDGLD
jgi:hypothetical protein